MKTIWILCIVIFLTFAILNKPVQSEEPPEYKIISSQYKENVEMEVFDALINGYQLHGSLAACSNKINDLVYIQVVTK